MTGHEHDTAERTGQAEHTGSVESPRIDTTRPHPARMYDWFLGGKDNYPVDVEMGKQLVAMDPRTLTMARANRAFMERGTGWLARNGVRQFLDRTRSCCGTPRPCCAPRPRASPSTYRPTRASRRPSSNGPAGSWTSRSRWRCR